MLFISRKSLYVVIIAVILTAFGVGTSFVRGAASLTATPDVSKEINDLSDIINQKKKQLDDLKSKQAEYQKSITKKQSERASLRNQLSIVDSRLAEAQLNLDQVKIDIETTNLEIQKTNLEIAENNQSIDRSKGQLAAAIRLLDQEAGRSQLEVLLLNSYLTEYISQIKYLEDINGKISEGLTSLKTAKESLAKSKTELESNKEKLRTLQQQYEGQQVQLASEKDSKNYLLDETRSSEVAFQDLLAQAKREQSAANSDIVSLEKTLRNKINEQSGDKIQLTYNGLIWPVSSRRITAYFHDPSYPFRYIFEHPGIDIGIPQGTSLKAAASGYVGRAKNAGQGYSYIMIVHADGLATVYGHVSAMYVKDNEFVTQGQIIGLSGGTPGTPGAGGFTTGPHLHMEVRLNGIPVNPLEYLP